MTFDIMTWAVIVYKIKQISHGKNSKDIYAQVHFALEKIYTSLIMEENLTGPQILDHKTGNSVVLVAFCLHHHNAQCNCQCVGSQFIASKMHSRVNTDYIV